MYFIKSKQIEINLDTNNASFSSVYYYYLLKRDSKNKLNVN